MLTINNRLYKLVLIDTCIVSELLKKKGELSKNLISKLIENRFACFSIQTIKELKFAPDLFDCFFDVFTVFPSLILKDSEMLIEEEILNYEKQIQIDPIITRLSKDPRKNETFDAKSFINSYFTEEYLKKFKEEQHNALDCILELKSNYKPKNKSYTLKEINTFIELVGYQQLVFRHKDWCKSFAERKKAIEIEKFPAVQILCFLVFYKFYINNRKPKLSDTSDLLISTAYPYVDEIITEKDQAEMMGQIQKKHDFCNHLEIYTIKDFL